MTSGTSLDVEGTKTSSGQTARRRYEGKGKRRAPKPWENRDKDNIDLTWA